MVKMKEKWRREEEEHQRKGEIKRSEGRKEGVEQNESCQLYADAQPRWLGWNQPFRIPCVNQPSHSFLEAQSTSLYQPIYSCDIFHLLLWAIIALQKPALFPGICIMLQNCGIRFPAALLTSLTAWYYPSCLCDGGPESLSSNQPWSPGVAHSSTLKFLLTSSFNMTDAEKALLLLSAFITFLINET